MRCKAENSTLLMFLVVAVTVIFMLLFWLDATYDTSNTSQFILSNLYLTTVFLGAGGTSLGLLAGKMLSRFGYILKQTDRYSPTEMKGQILIGMFMLLLTASLGFGLMSACYEIIMDETDRFTHYVVPDFEVNIRMLSELHEAAKGIDAWFLQHAPIEMYAFVFTLHIFHTATLYFTGKWLFGAIWAVKRYREVQAAS